MIDRINKLAAKIKENTTSIAATNATVRASFAVSRKTETSLAGSVKKIKDRLACFSPHRVEKDLNAMEERVKAVDEMIHVMVTRAAVASELHFFSTGLPREKAAEVNLDVLYSLNLPHDFWADRRDSDMTIAEWSAKLRSARLRGG